MNKDPELAKTAANILINEIMPFMKRNNLKEVPINPDTVSILALCKVLGLLTYKEVKEEIKLQLNNPGMELTSLQDAYLEMKENGE